MGEQKKVGADTFIRSGTRPYPVRQSPTGGFKKADFERALKKVASAKPSKSSNP